MPLASGMTRNTQTTAIPVCAQMSHRQPTRTSPVKVILLLIALGRFLPSADLLATTYYVSITGSDTNSGTALQPWQTIQNAADTMVPGDTVLVMPGTYPERVTTVNNGSPGSNITFQAQGPGVVIIGVFVIANSYTVLNGFEFTGNNCINNNTAAIWVTSVRNSDPSNSQVWSNYIHDIWCVNGTTTNHESGISLGGSNQIVACNIISNCSPAGISFGGNNNLISNNWVATVPVGVLAFGSNQEICCNVFTNISDPFNTGKHPDIIQSWGYCSLDGVYGYSHDVIFERNYAVDSLAEICQMTDDCCTGALSNWTIRNNIWNKVGLAAVIQFPGAHWYNNTFYQCNQNSGQVLSFGDDTNSPCMRGQAWQAQSFNNAFIECFSATNNPETATRGWYSADAHLTDFVANTDYIGSSNGVAKSVTFSTFPETNGVNGGLWDFANENASDFHLLSNSILIHAGTTLS
jgi:hypothetical protein